MVETWQSEVMRLKSLGVSENDITRQMVSLFPELDLLQVKDKIRSVIRPDRQVGVKKIVKALDKPVGIIGDLHTPFVHPGYLPFVIDTFKRFDVGTTVFIGDITDQYSYSRFTKKPLAMNPKQEKELAKVQITGYVEAFPRAKVCMGNHDTRYIDNAEENGIDAEIIKEFRDIYDIPKTWEFYDEYENYLIMNDVLYIHGSAYNGEKGAKQAALNEQMSVVMGHGHSFAGVSPIANKRKLMFGMNVGCGIDIGAYAFAYNKKDKFRPLLGCGIVFNSSYAIWVPMGKEYFRTVAA